MLGNLAADGIDRELVHARTATSSRERDRPDAFKRLLDEELERSYRLAAVILRDPAEAEDAVHDAAETAWRRWADLRNPAAAAVWYRRIVINCCRDRLRSRRRRRLFELLRAPTAAEQPTTPDSTDASARRDLLRHALNRLSADERVTLVLRYEQDMTVAAIARLTAVPEGTVKSRLHNARRKLRAAIGEVDE